MFGYKFEQQHGALSFLCEPIIHLGYSFKLENGETTFVTRDVNVVAIVTLMGGTLCS